MNRAATFWVRVSTRYTAAVARTGFRSQPTIEGGITASLNAIAALPTGAERMLAYAASRHPHSVTRGQMVAYARISPKSSNVGKFLKLLTEQGYLCASGNGYSATELGCKLLPHHEPLPDDPRSKLEAWRSRLNPGAVRMLDAISNHPSGIAKDRVLDLSGVSRTSSNAGKFFKQLREYGLITITNNTCRMHEDYR